MAVDFQHRPRASRWPVPASAASGPLGRARAILLKEEGFELARYKPDCAQRRLARAMARGVGGSAEAFLGRAAWDRAARRRLIEALLVSHSEFLRNPDLFERLAERVIPELLSRRPGQRFEILCAGCGRGEEPYSLALLLRERFASQWGAGRFAIRGLDLNAEAISRARRGRYDLSRLSGVPPRWMARYFRPLGEAQYELLPPIRGRVSFAVQDLFDLPPAEGEEDLILVRNLCIYLTRRAQRSLLEVLGRRLRPGGYLVLGRTESLPPQMRGSYEAADPCERLYRKLGSGRSGAGVGAKR